MSSVFASLRKKTLTHDSFGTVSVSIRGLSPRALEAAQKEHQRQALQTVKEARANGSEEAFAAVDPAAVEAYQAKVAAEPVLSYDQASLVEKGVEAWGFELPLSAESVAELDEDVLKYIATEVLRLSKPSLFRTVEEQEADRKNG